MLCMCASFSLKYPSRSLLQHVLYPTDEVAGPYSCLWSPELSLSPMLYYHVTTAVCGRGCGLLKGQRVREVEDCRALVLVVEPAAGQEETQYFQ